MITPVHRFEILPTYLCSYKNNTENFASLNLRILKLFATEVCKFLKK